MNSLISQIKSLQNSGISKLVNKRLSEFESFKNKSNKHWFSELCFCILTANSKQKTAETIQKKLGPNKLRTISQQDLSTLIRENKHRFHNNKARYIVEARKFSNVKIHLSKIQTETEKRDFLVKNIKGLGMKESSHFLRNTGHRELAILDRHILNLMHDNKLIQKPKTLTPKIYLEIEKTFNLTAKKLNMSSAELDLYMWYLKTNEVAK